MAGRRQPWKALVAAFAVLLFLPAAANASFAPEGGTPPAVGAGPVGIVSADFNGDTRPDLAVANSSASADASVHPDSVSILLRQSSGGFADAPGSPISFSMHYAPRALAVADFNGDTKLDLAVLAGSGAVTVLLGQGGGAFSAEPSPVSTFASPTGLVATDFNGDTRPDIAVSDGSFIQIFLRKQTGGFDAEPTSPISLGSVGALGLDTADFNDDNRPDLALPFTSSDAIGVYLRKDPQNDGFVAETGSPFAAGDNPVTAAVGDFNDDGRPDLVAAASNSSRAITTLLRNSGGGFTTESGSLNAADHPIDIAAGDFNSDGRDDFAVTESGFTDKVEIYLRNLANNGFVQDSSSPADAGDTPQSIAVADFDDDNKLDLAIADMDNSGSGRGSVKVLLNTTVGSNPPDTSITSGPSGTTTDTTPTFTFSSSPLGATFECRIDSGAFAPCTSPFTTPTLSFGQHTLRVRAKNAGGTDPSAAVRTFTVAPPVSARFSGPPKIAPMRMAVLDARGSTGAARFLWDVTGDGQTDVTCGKSEPFLGVRLAQATSRTVALTVVASTGTRAFGKQKLTVSGASLGSAQRRTVDTAFCSRGDAFFNPSEVTGACASSVTFGVVEARGCFDKVAKAEDIPAAERQIVNEYYAVNDVPENLRSACENGASRCPDVLSKIKALDVLVAHGPVRFNGVGVYPHHGAPVVVFPQLQRIVSHDADFAVDKYTIKTGGINLDLRGRLEGSGAGARAFGKLPAVAHLLRFDAARDLPAVGGFKLSGTADLTLRRTGARYYSRLDVGMQLPQFFSVFGDFPPAGEAVIEADTAHGLLLGSLHLAIKEANLGGIRLANLAFDYDAAGNAAFNCPSKWWRATADVFLGQTGNDAGFRLSPPPDRNGVAFCAGDFHHAGGAIVFGTQIPPPQPFPGVFITEIGFNVGLDPTVLRGDMTMTVADVTEVHGALFAVFATPSDPYVLTTGDAGQAFGQLAGQRYVSTTFAVGGDASLKVPSLGKLPIGNAYFLYSYPDYVALGGDIRVEAPGMFVHGGVNGEFNASSRRFSTHGDVDACVAGGLGCVGVEGWVTSKGAVVCGSVAGELHPGAGYAWGDAWPTIWLVDGCKPSRYWETNIRGAAAGDQTFTVKKGERVKNVRLDGKGGAPEVEITGPDGEKLSTAAKDFGHSKTLRVLRQAQGDVTWIGVEAGKPGTYTVKTLPGSVPMADIAASRPGSAPRVSARVTGKGRTRVLHWAVAKRPGQQVALFERGGATFKRLATTSGGKGKRRFKPALGPAGTRRVVAQISIDGVPAPDRVVARFRAPKPPRPGKPGKLRVRRRGTTITARWGKARNATAYGVALRKSNGVHVLRRTSAKRRSLRIKHVAKTLSGRVSVHALGPLGDWGPARRGRFRATKRARSQLLPYKELGKGRR